MDEHGHRRLPCIEPLTLQLAEMAVQHPNCATVTIITREVDSGMVTVATGTRLKGGNILQLGEKMCRDGIDHIRSRNPKTYIRK